MEGKKRIPIIAATLSFFASGLGQLYNGQILKGIAFFLAFSLIQIILCLTGLQYQFYGLVAILIVSICLWLFIIGEAFFVAKRKREIALKGYNKWYIYLLIILLVNSTYIIPSDFIANIAGEVLGIRSYKIPTGSMEPTLSIGDCLIAGSKYFKKNELQRGDLVIFLYPEDPTKDFLKRVIALEGETIEIKNKKVYINDKPIPEEYKTHIDSQIRSRDDKFYYRDIIRDNYGPVVVPPGQCFVMGDNRDNSQDSRYYGFIPLGNLKGKPLYIYWAKDKNRIGKKIK